EQKLTRRQVCDQWPEDFVKPDNVTIWRWLDRAVAEGRVLQAGTGRKNDPFQYWLRSSEERWANDPNRLENFLDPLPELPSMRDLMGLGPRPGKKGGRSGNPHRSSCSSGWSRPSNGVRSRSAGTSLRTASKRARKSVGAGPSATRTSGVG